jgi:SAM-dependent methyltransferase
VNSLDDSGAVFNYHRNMAVLHGSDSSLALGWLKGKTVLDAGCGYADLLTFLSPDNKPSRYYGVEQIPELIEEAKDRYEHMDDVTLIARNFMMTDLPIADYVFASGSLNYGSSDAGYIFKAISKLLAHCRTLSNNVILKDDYDEQDFTVWMYR